MAKQEVRVNFNNLPKGEPVTVPGVGDVANGSTVKVDDFQIQTWESFTGAEWPKDGLELPAPAPEPTQTDAQLEGQIQTAILERQSNRSEKEAQKEEAALTKAILRGEWPMPLMVDGQVVKGPKDPVKAGSTEPKEK